MENNNIVNFRNLLSKASYIKKNNKKFNRLFDKSTFRHFSSIFMGNLLPAYIPQETELALSFSNMDNSSMNIRTGFLPLLYRYLLIDYIVIGKFSLSKVMINNNNLQTNPIIIIFNFESYLQACEKGRREEIENHLEVFINIDYYLHLINRKSRLNDQEMQFLTICNNVIKKGNLLENSDLKLINNGKVKFISNKAFISKFKLEIQKRGDIVTKSERMSLGNLIRTLNFENLKNKNIIGTKSLKIVHELATLRQSAPPF
jgi:hypothetical protein